jgi:hypothetical protein
LASFPIAFSTAPEEADRVVYKVEQALTQQVAVTRPRDPAPSGGGKPAGDGATRPNDGGDGATRPADGSKPADGTSKPTDGTTKPTDSTTKPTDSTSKPAEPTPDFMK